MDNHNRIRIAWFSPLHGISDAAESSVSAYVTNEISRYYVDGCDIDFFHGTKQCLQRSHVFHFEEALRRHAIAPYDIFFYQIEDLECCRFAAKHLTFMPGVALFHDIVFRDHQGPLPVSLLGNVEKAFFSTERNLSEFRRCYPTLVSVPCSYLPYPVSLALSTFPTKWRTTAAMLSQSPEDRAVFDSKVGKEDRSDILTVGFFGSTNIEYRAHYLLQAISSLPFPCQLLWVVAENEREKASHLVEEFAVSAVELFSPRSFEAWREVLRRVDASVHPLFSAYGDPGPALAMSLMAGIPCAVTDFSASALLPDSVVWKIQSGDLELLDLTNFLSACFGQTERIRNQRDTAERYAREFHDAQMVAAEFQRILLGAKPISPANRADSHIVPPASLC